MSHDATGESMKERPMGFLNPKEMSPEVFSYIVELHEYLWRVVKVAFPGAGGYLNDYIPAAVKKLEAPRSETAPLVTGDLAKQREIHDTYAPVSATPQNDDAPRLDWIFGVLNTDEITRRVQAVSDVYACGSIHGIRLGDVRHAIDVAKQQYVEPK